MSTTADMLRAVCSDPHDFGLRLIYADMLEEQGNPRADFIRVQCRLAEIGPAPGIIESVVKSHGPGYWDAVVAADREFPLGQRLDVHSVRRGANKWHRGLVVKQARVHRDGMTVRLVLASDDRSPLYAEAAKLRRRERKLVRQHNCTWQGELYGPIADAEVAWCLENKRQRASGDPFGFEFHGGFVEHVTCTIGRWCRWAEEESFPPEHGSTLVQLTPVTRVSFRDCAPQLVPGQRRSDPMFWAWSSSPRHGRDEPSQVPRRIWERLTGRVSGDWCFYDSGTAAEADLSNACLAWARAEAGLPPLSKETELCASVR